MGSRSFFDPRHRVGRAGPRGVGRWLANGGFKACADGATDGQEVCVRERGGA